jgi:hypothetical protein
VREVQDHQAQGQSHGHLRQPQAQAASGLKIVTRVGHPGGTQKNRRKQEFMLDKIQLGLIK